MTVWFNRLYWLKQLVASVVAACPVVVIDAMEMTVRRCLCYLEEATRGDIDLMRGVIYIYRRL